ncbi:hypothetical protein M758_10G116100 [Ceratodon purpureus]|uniref:Uncharacterized protein n=1 Tax=Ceratodon purpureus TaxID=3225 RepID=A0A8T0GM38_CERPU|nr:hypothetical protein KC19_10G120500 [Ceratodon purpureus]KAG0603717.1 hypothetical protein M758_10G116100 [Ceratodon purpureus]
MFVPWATLCLCWGLVSILSPYCTGSQFSGSCVRQYFETPEHVGLKKSKPVPCLKEGRSSLFVAAKTGA